MSVGAADDVESAVVGTDLWMCVEDALAEGHSVSVVWVV